VPAAAVIPAPIAYIKVVAVKKLVVGFWIRLTGPGNLVLVERIFPLGKLVLSFMAASGLQDFYCEKIRVFKAGMCLNTLAWNNGIGFWFYFVGF
jgi:hypothetical protein